MRLGASRGVASAALLPGAGLRLRVQSDDLIGNLLDVGNATERNAHLRGHVISAARQHICHENDVAGAVGAFAMLDVDDISGRIDFTERFLDPLMTMTRRFVTP